MVPTLQRDWEGYFAEQRREAQHRAQVARDYWAQTDEERRLGLERLGEICAYDPVEDAILRRTERDPMEQFEEDLAEYQRHDSWER